MTGTPTVEGRPVREHLGFGSGERVPGASVFRDLVAGIRDIVGGRSRAYESSLRQAKEMAPNDLAERAAELGADAVLAIDLDYESIQTHQSGGMLMVTASGTAVKLG